jgi:kumamolisin
MCADEGRINTPQNRLAGSERPRPASHRHLGPAAPAETVAITLVVRRRQNSPPLPDLEQWRNTPRGMRKYISPQQYAQTYGAAPAEIEAAAAFVRAFGMTVLEAHAGRRTLSILGTAEQANRLFGIELQRYADPRAPEIPEFAQGNELKTLSPRSHRGFDGAVHLPIELAGILTAVVGLDDRFLGAPRGAAVGGQAGAGYPPVSTVAQQYHLPDTGAAGETIAIFAAQPPGLPGMPPCYLPSDINNLYFPNLPADYQTRPASILDINLTVGATTYKNDPSQVTGIASLDEAKPAILELTQDISTSATLAQGATVNVYFTEASEQGYLVFMNRVLLPEHEKQPTVLSLSLAADLGAGSQEGAARNRIGSRGETGSLSYLIDELFRQVAVQGISVFIAVGDCGADTWYLLAAPNLAPQELMQKFEHGPQAGAASSSLARTHLGNYAAFLAIEKPMAAGTAVGRDFASFTRTGPGVPDASENFACSGFFVNGIPYSYVGSSCVAPFYAGMTALLRSAFGMGLESLNTMLFELRKTALKDGPSEDRPSQESPGPASGKGAARKGNAPKPPFFNARTGWSSGADRSGILHGLASIRCVPGF